MEMGFCLHRITFFLITFVSSSFSLPLLKTVSINKAINAQEVAVKEKHARNILLKLELWKKNGEAGKVGYIWLESYSIMTCL